MLTFLSYFPKHILKKYTKNFIKGRLNEVPDVDENLAESISKDITKLDQLKPMLENLKYVFTLSCETKKVIDKPKKMAKESMAKAIKHIPSLKEGFKEISSPRKLVSNAAPNSQNVSNLISFFSGIPERPKEFIRKRRDTNSKKIQKKCIACEEETFVNKFKNCTEDHLCCKNCLQKQILIGLHSGNPNIICQYCKCKVSYRDIRELLKDEQKEFFIYENLTKSYNSGDICCYNCNSIQYRGGFDNFIVCRKCSARTCISHGKRYCGKNNNYCCVDGLSTEKELRLSSAWISKNTVICPNCSIPIERYDGCKHMECTKCKTHFCWTCSEIFDKNDFLLINEHLRFCPRF